MALLSFHTIYLFKGVGRTLLVGTCTDLLPPLLHVGRLLDKSSCCTVLRQAVFEGHKRSVLKQKCRRCRWSLQCIFWQLSFLWLCCLFLPENPSWLVDLPALFWCELADGNREPLCKLLVPSLTWSLLSFLILFALCQGLLCWRTGLKENLLCFDLLFVLVGQCFDLLSFLCRHFHCWYPHPRCLWLLGCVRSCLLLLLSPLFLLALASFHVLCHLKLRSCQVLASDVVLLLAVLMVLSPLASLWVLASLLIVARWLLAAVVSVSLCLLLLIASSLPVVASPQCLVLLLLSSWLVGHWWHPSFVCSCLAWSVFWWSLLWPPCCWCQGCSDLLRCPYLARTLLPSLSYALLLVACKELFHLI